MEDWSISALNTHDLLPKKRLDALYEKAKLTHVDNGVDVRRYFDIANEILKSAKKMRRENKCEESLLNFLRYQILVKKLKSHVSYRNVHIGERAAFDYKLKDVTRNVKYLTERVLGAYKKLYDITDINMDNFSIEGYPEQRPTFSTIRTFVSTPRPSAAQDHMKALSAPIRGRSKSILTQGAASANHISLMKSISSLISEGSCGVRRSIFPMKQVKEFDEIHKQSRKVRGHRTVVIPSRITTAFSYLSLDNNRKNIETVGYLAGKELNASRLIVTHLLLPKQQGYSDYFKVTDSGPLVQYLNDEDLMTIGWIHSHPVETPYMSSSDMHYHGIFQGVLPEAVAIVYSPKEMRSKVFNLTPDHGLQTIEECRKKGFHTHPTKCPLTMVSLHTVTDLLGDLTVKDFRWEGDDLKLATDTEQIVKGSSGVVRRNLLERFLQVKTSTGALAPVRIRQSEVNFVHLDGRI